MSSAAKAQHQFKGTSLSEALIALDNSSKRYDISFLYDELEDFTVTKNIRKSSSLPEAVREVCGFYPVKITVKGHDILVECIQKDKTKLTGRLVNGENQAIAYANILLLSPSDSTVLGGGVSNEAGDFVIPCSAREAKVRISCVGYQTIERTLPIGNVGTLKMKESNNRLGAVTVSGQAPIIRNEADRVTYVVKHDQFAHELSALEVLNRVPMISVTGGKASILGKGEAHFMLNGRIMEQGSETIHQKLWSLRAEDIERIEIISVPSGKYQTEGEGFINIVLNPANTEGWRADVSAQGALNDGFTRDNSKSRYSGQMNASLNYGSSKFDFSLEVYKNRLTGAKQTTYNYTNIDLSKYGLDAINKQKTRRTDNRDENDGIDVMLRYRPKKNIELGAMVSRHGQKLYMNTNESSPQYTFEAHSKMTPINTAISTSLTTFGDWTFDEQGRKLSLTYNYYKRTSEDEIGNSCLDNINNKLFYYTSSAVTEYQLHDVKADLTLPYKDIMIDAGLAYTFIKSPSTEIGGIFGSINTYYDYREKTAAGYVTLQRKFYDNKLSAKLGLRFERTWLEGVQCIYSSMIGLWYFSPVKEENNRSYNNLLPTLHLNYRLGGHHQLSLAYGIGVNRPNLHDLNPLRFYTTYTDYTTGNPSLLHGKTHSLELSYTNGNGLYTTAYHHKGDNQVEWISEFYNSGTTDSVSIQQTTYPINCIGYNKTGINLRYQHRFSPLASAIVEGDTYYYDATASYATSHYDNTVVTPKTSSSTTSGWAGRISLCGDVFLNQKHTWMISARYDQWLKDYQGLSRYDAYGYFSFAVRCSLLRDRLKLSLAATDPFNQYVTDSYRSLMFDEHIHTNHHLTNVSLTATFQLFNHTKVNYKK